MDIVTKTIDAKAITVQMIRNEFEKMNKAGEKERIIKLSLDTTKPEIIAVEKSGNAYSCRYKKKGVLLFEGLVVLDELNISITNMLDKAYEAMENEEFKDKCYEAYQLDWMLSHGFSLNDLYKAQLKYMQEMFDPEDFIEDGDEKTFDFDESDLERSMEQGRDILLYEQGLGNGSIFVTKNEFLQAEFLDDWYMRHLLGNMPDSKNLKLLYKKIMLLENGVEVAV